MDVGIRCIWQLPSGAALIEIKSSVPSHSAGDVHQAARHLETLFLKIEKRSGGHAVAMAHIKRLSQAADDSLYC